MTNTAITKWSIAILVIGILAIFTPDADAGCIGNPRFCASYIKGSVICQGLKNGLGKKKFCLSETDCGEVMCGITGTSDSTGQPTANCNDSTCAFTADPTCAMSGTAVCSNHGGGTGGVGQPFNLEGVISGASSQATCPKPGQCLFSITLDTDPDSSAIVCQNKNWTVVDFSVTEFKGKTCYCSNNQGGVIFNPGNPADPTQTVFSGQCADFTAALCITEVCELNGNVYDCNNPGPVACQ